MKIVKCDGCGETTDMDIARSPGSGWTYGGNFDDNIYGYHGRCPKCNGGTPKTGNGMTKITGNTFPVKDELKAMGGRWNAKDKVWEVPSDRAEEAKKVVQAVIKNPPPWSSYWKNPKNCPAPKTPAPQVKANLPANPLDAIIAIVNEYERGLNASTAAECMASLYGDDPECAAPSAMRDIVKVLKGVA